jgi:hypothetical protein
MVMMAMGQQYVRDPDTFPLGQLNDLWHFPGRIDDRTSPGGMVVDQVDKIFHRPKL